jgi:hypothetical protein
MFHGFTWSIAGKTFPFFSMTTKVNRQNQNVKIQAELVFNSR